MILKAKIWKFGDSLAATDVLSSQYDRMGLSGQWNECAKHLLETIDPDFATGVEHGDLFIAGENLGLGHAHYHLSAIMACKAAGLGGLFAESINGLFQRAAIDHGLPCWSIKGVSALVDRGERVEIDLSGGTATNLATGRGQQFNPVPEIILDILKAGGSRNWALRRAGAPLAIV
jgi:3-isopropylmalate/(R)-2-methylmalate dehydratase small subunit